MRHCAGMLFALGAVALIVVVGAVIAVIVMAGRQEKEERAPVSLPGDFVAPVSSGGYAFRRTEESEDEFKKRIANANADHEKRKSSRPPPA